jgi:tRNA dimethylallyltransferase
LQKVQEIFTHNNVAVVVGGTGLYADAFCKGMDNIPAIDEHIRANIIANYQQHGLPWLQAQIKTADPLFYHHGEIQNPQRLMRALEVKLGTNQSIIHFQQHQQKKRDFNIVKIGIELHRQTLIECINSRVDAMVEQGLLQEVTALLPHQQLNALQTVGYKELFAYLNGKTSLPVAIEAIKISTRQYAKRQMTWFKRDNAINWCAPQIKQVKDFLPSL